jgi:hypothetical protein
VDSQFKKDAQGRFEKGTGPGPGRPRKSEKVSEEFLVEMAGVRGVDLYWTAKALADREEWMESIRISFDAKIVARIERLAELAECCEEEFIRRVPKGEG